jgi:proline iminopeptidase
VRVPPWIEQRVTVDDGVVLWTASGGCGSIPLALCHGGAGLWDYLQPVADSLSAVARVHRWEQRGCGRSDRLGPYTIERYVTDLECLRAHFGHDRWLLAGHSWGAGLALRYALAHPERVLGVLYISGTGFGHALEDPAAFGAVARDFVAERGGSPCRIHRSPAA